MTSPMFPLCDRGFKRKYYYCTRRKDHYGPCALVPRWHTKLINKVTGRWL